MERAEQFALVARASQAREMKFPMFLMFTSRSLRVPMRSHSFPLTGPSQLTPHSVDFPSICDGANALTLLRY